MRQSTFILLFMLIMALPVQSYAQTKDSCLPQDITCLLSTINSESQKIIEPKWKNNSLRDLAVSTAFHGDIDGAINLISKIDNADTQAMTIRAIGMALAIHKKLTPEEYKVIFTKLDKAAKIITVEGARDIAYTYIAMAQAFAGLDGDATLTTQSMVNEALRHKAYAETAEIQAKRGDFNASAKSLNAITSTAFKNKASANVSEIFVKADDYDSALKIANLIDNPVTKAGAYQKIVDAQLGLNKQND